MARRKSNNDEAVSLFPFMSILACLIGILTLMISVSMGLNESQDKGATEEEKAMAVQNRDLKLKAESISTQILKVEEKAKRENSSSVQFNELKDMRIVLRDKLEGLKKADDPAKTDAALQKSVEVMKKEIVALKKEQPVLNKHLEELKKKLAELKNPPKKVESVMVRPGGSGFRAAQRLFFVECNSTGIVLIDETGKETIVATAAINSSSAYSQFLTQVKNTKDSMVLFLIRKEGNGAYFWAAGIADSKFEVKTGKLPIPNNGKIDLSVFRKK